MTYNIVPYAEVDGIRTIRDSNIMALFRRTEKDNLVKKVFYDGLIENEFQFLDMVKSPGVLFYMVYDGENVIGYSWLNYIEARSARFNFCFFKEYHGKVVDAGKFIVESLINMVSYKSEYVFDILTGLTPERNKLALSFVEKCGAKRVVVIPNAVFNKESGKSENAVLFYYMRGE